MALLALTPSGIPNISDRSPAQAHGASCQKLLQSRQRALSVAWTPDSRFIVSGHMYGTVAVWDVERCERVKEFPCGNAHIRFLSLSPSGAWLAIGDDLATTQIYGVAGSFALPSRSTLASYSFSPSSDELAIAYQDKSIHIVDLMSGKVTRSFSTECTVSHMTVFDSDGSSIATLYDHFTTTIRHAQTGRPLYIHDQPEKSTSMHPAVWIAYTPCSRFLILAGDRAIIIRDVASGRNLGEIDVGKNDCRALSSDGRLLATGTAGSIRVWEISNAKVALCIEGAEILPGPLAFSPNGEYLLGVTTKGPSVWAISPMLTHASRAKPQSELGLNSDDSTIATTAIYALARDPHRSLPILTDILTSVETTRIQRWIADLDSESIETRESARAELLRQPTMESEVTTVLGHVTSNEQRSRMHELLAVAASPIAVPAGRLRIIRALQTLELLASADAKNLLATLSMSNRDARNCLNRLKTQESLSTFQDRFRKILATLP